MVKNYHRKIIDTLEKHQISRAIYFLKVWAKDIESYYHNSSDLDSNPNYDHTDHNNLVRYEELDSIEQRYSTWLTSISNQAETSETESTVNHIAAECYILADYYNCLYFDYANDTFEQKQMHIERAAHKDLATLLDKISTYHHQISLQLSPNRKQYEDNLNNLFNYFWLYFGASNANYESDIALFRKIIINTTQNDYGYGELAQPLAVSALTLNILRNFSEDNILLLIESLDSPNVRVETRAYVGLCLIIGHYYNRYNIIKRFTQIIDEEIIHNSERLKKCQLTLKGLIRTLETEHLSQILSNEVEAEIAKKVKDINASDFKIEDLTANTDWSDYSNSLENKIIKLQEMLFEGSDIHYNTFYRQKKLPFFNSISHWFMPFDSQWSDIAIVYKSFPQQLQKVVNIQYMCDSDLYSLHLAISFLSTNNQDNIKQFLSNNLPDMSDEDEGIDFNHAEHLFADTLNNYIQNLYRFFKNNPFYMNDFYAEIPNYASSIIPILFKSDDQTQLDLANFYFNKEQYQPALSLYKSLEQTMASNELFQKMGYCAQQDLDIVQALKYYTIANTFKPNDLWTLKHMIACTYNTQQKISLYENILQIDEDNQWALLGLASLYVQMESYDQAISIYYKLDFIYPDTLNIERELALCAMHKHDFSTALRYWNKITEKSNNNEDIIYKAHTYLLQNDLPQAIKTYTEAWQLTDKKSEFWSSLRSEEHNLLKFGLSEKQFHYINEILIDRLYVKTINI